MVTTEVVGAQVVRANCTLEVQLHTVVSGRREREGDNLCSFFTETKRARRKWRAIALVA